MIINIKKVIEICVKFKITIEDFFFLYLISTRDTANMRMYVNHIDGFSDKFMTRLEKKGLLLDMTTYKSKDDFYEDGSKRVMLHNLHTTPDFDTALESAGEAIDLQEAYDELMDVYPYEITGTNGQKYNARTGTYETNSEKYLKYIKRNPDEHETIVAATKYGRDNNLIKMGLEKYIATRYWGSLIATMEDSQNNNNSGEPKYGENEF